MRASKKGGDRFPHALPDLEGRRQLTVYKRIYVLRFPKSIVDQPIVCELVRKFDISFNILKATVLPLQAGLMVLELHGHKKNIDNGLKY